jgi:hypothetical protein
VTEAETREQGKEIRSSGTKGGTNNLTAGKERWIIGRMERVELKSLFLFFSRNEYEEKKSSESLSEFE